MYAEAYHAAVRRPPVAVLPKRDRGVAGDLDTYLYHLDLHAGIRHVLVYLADF